MVGNFCDIMRQSRIERREGGDRNYGRDIGSKGVEEVGYDDEVRPLS